MAVSLESHLEKIKHAVTVDVLLFSSAQCKCTLHGEPTEIKLCP